VHKPSGKPVPAAAIVQTRIDMAPDGMASMAAMIVPLPNPEPGVYAFKAPLTMTGRWLLTVSAKVQDEPETITGEVIFTVGR
jgi:YtkA-like